MATHSIRIDYDESSGHLSVVHRCTVEVGGHAVSHAEEIVLNDPAAVAAVLAKFVDGNRAEMEERTTALALQHAAALAGKAGKGVKQLKLGGSLAAVGETSHKG